MPSFTASKEKGFFFKLSRQRQVFFLTFPIVLYVILFTYVPLWGWTMAFQNFKAAKKFLNQEWVGLYWFRFLFDDKQFLLTVRNTIAMSVINTTLGFITAIALALMLNEVKSLLFKRFIQTVSYLPHFLSGVIVCGLVSSMLTIDSGAINNLLMLFGFIKEPVQWLGKPNYFWGIIGITYVWKEVGWNTIIYLAAIAGIDPNLYEAASIDGVTVFKKCGILRSLVLNQLLSFY